MTKDRVSLRPVKKIEIIFIHSLFESLQFSFVKTYLTLAQSRVRPMNEETVTEVFGLRCSNNLLDRYDVFVESTRTEEEDWHC
jgi:hypothetical protein